MRLDLRRYAQPPIAHNDELLVISLGAPLLLAADVQTNILPIFIVSDFGDVDYIVGADVFGVVVSQAVYLLPISLLFSLHQKRQEVLAHRIRVVCPINQDILPMLRV